MSAAENRPSALFRTEALKWRQDSLIGTLSLIEPVSGKVVSCCTMILVICVLAYVTFGSYTRRIHASGAMLPSTGLIVSESDQNGIVTKAFIHEGSHVKMGDRLFALDVETWSETGPIGKQSLMHLMAERDLLLKRHQLLTQDAPIELSSYKDQLVFLNQQRGMLNDEIARDKVYMPLVEHAMNEMRSAMDKHLVTESQFQSQLYTYVQFMNTHSQNLRSLVDTGEQISNLNAKIHRHPFKVNEDLNDIDVRLSDINQKITQAQGRAGALITVPVTGTIDGIRAHPGQRVTMGQALASILPDDAVFVAELYIDSKAIGFVRPGQKVLLKYAAYPYQRFGLYGGHVIEVTHAPVTDRHEHNTQVGSNIPNTGSSNDIYRIRVQPDEPFVRAYGKREALKPGMAVEADIAVDRRKLYQWILEPAISMTDTIKSMSERTH